MLAKCWMNEWMGNYFFPFSPTTTNLVSLKSQEFLNHQNQSRTLTSHLSCTFCSFWLCFFLEIPFFGFYGLMFPSCSLRGLFLCPPDRFLTLSSPASSLTTPLGVDLGSLPFLYTLTRSWQSQPGFQTSFYDVGLQSWFAIMIGTFPTSLPFGNLHLLNLECEATCNFDGQQSWESELV